MTVRGKLLACFGGMLAVVVAIGWASLSSVAQMESTIEKLTSTTARKLQLAGEASTAESEMLAAQRAMMLYAFAKDQAQVERARSEFQRNVEQFRKAFTEIEPLLVSQEARALIGTAKSRADDWNREFPQLAALCAAGKPDEAWGTVAPRIAPIAEDIDKATTQFSALLIRQTADDRKASESDASSSRWLAFALIGLALGAGALVFLVVRKVNDALTRSSRSLSESADQVAAAAGQVSSASQSLAQGASQQAASIEETSASAEQITSMTRKNADNSLQVAALMETSEKTVAEVNRTLDEMMRSMGEINSSSDKIAKIIKVIDEIAFQTNILALNAAVEAARAGEAGMGFAVVADEVRSLAQRCAQAAKDTAALIEESISRTGAGSRKLDDVGRAMKSNTEIAGKVKTLVDEVSLGSQEQARGVTEVSKALNEMQRVTQKTAASSEETASAGEELSALAASMRGTVDELSRMVGAAASQSAAAPPKPGRAEAAVAFGHAGRKPARPAVSKPPAAAEAFPLEEDFKEF